jgi:hypothetical protein
MASDDMVDRCQPMRDLYSKAHCGILARARRSKSMKAPGFKPFIGSFPIQSDNFAILPERYDEESAAHPASTIIFRVLHGTARRRSQSFLVRGVAIKCRSTLHRPLTATHAKVVGSHAIRAKCGECECKMERWLARKCE